MGEIRKRLSLSPRERGRLLLRAGAGIELAVLEWTFGRPADTLEAALDDCRRNTRVPPDIPETGAREDGDGPPLPSPPLRRALEALGERATATLAGYALDGQPASIPDLIRAARAAGTRIPYPGIDPLPGSFATGPSARARPTPSQRRSPA